jgi:class 3 adenylate cyclase/tetratricopeptide (TPR) repeat protein
LSSPSIKCPQCGQENPPGIAICSNCATPLVNLCPNCGFENPRGFKFCGNCGTNLLTATLTRTSNSEQLRRLRGFIPGQLVDKILTASKQIEGERRTVTVLFSDVVGFTAISEKLDPEAVYNIIDESVAAFHEAIFAHEGTLDKFMGDGVMALFGAPVMHEDDPARAVRCALDMQTALKQINDNLVAQYGITLQMRIGLNLGTVVVGDIGADLKMNYTALGDTVNVASRLQSVAEPGTILASRAVYEQTRALFDFSELGSIRVKGRVEPVEIYQVLGVKRDPGRARGIPGLIAPMVGREKELARLKRVIESLVTEQRGGVVLITGEAGLGKSRLVSEAKQWLAQSSELNALGVLEGACFAYGQSAYDVFMQLFNNLLHVQPDDAAETRRNKLAARVRTLFPDIRTQYQVLPYLENLMGFPPVERELADRIRHLEPSQLRQQTFLAVRDLLIQEARLRPLILILEDLHWLDKPSLDLLLFLFNSVEEAPLLFVCVSRPTDNQATIQIQRIGSATLDGRFDVFALEPLSLTQSAALLDALLTISDLPDALRQLISQRAEGNPFFLEEILRTLIDRNMIRRRQERWEMTPGADISTFQVPRTLEGLIMTRVDNLPETTRHAVQCAAVIGRDFPDSILLRISETNPVRHENDLQELIDHELVAQTLRVPERQFAFRHILTQQTIYNSILLRRREQLHHKIAVAIEELYPTRLEEQAERLAFHYSESKDAVKALPHVVRSAERAAGRFANEEALSYYRTALDMATRTNAPLETRVRILVGLGDSQAHVGDFDGAATNLSAAWELVRQLKPDDKQARQASEVARRLGRVFERRGKYDDAMRWLESALREINRNLSSAHAVERVRIYLEIGWVHYRRGNLDEAEHWRLRALEISEGLDYYAEMGSAYNGLAALANLRGDWQRAIEYAQRGLEVREMIGDVEGMSRSHSNLGAIMLNVGEWDRALPHLEKSLELKRRIGDAKSLALAYINLGLYYLYKSDLAPAQEYLTSARKHAEKIRDPNAICLALNSLAQVEAAKGELDAAQMLLNESIKLAVNSGVRDWHAEGQSILAEVELRRGEIDAARIAGERALTLAQESGYRQTEANALRALGSIARAEGKIAEAERNLTRSIALSNELTSPYEAARGELELGLLYLDRGLHQQAQTYLLHCRETFDRLGASQYAMRAQTALVALAT